MSIDTKALDHDAQSERRPLDETDTGILGHLKRYFETWSRLYVEQRVEARTGRSH